MPDFLAVRVVDVNGNPVGNVTAQVQTAAGALLPGTVLPGGFGQPDTTVFDLKGLTDVSVGMTATDYFEYAVKLTRNLAAGTLEVDARSPQWGLFSTETLPIMPMLTLCARRVRPAPQRAFTTPAHDEAPPIVGDPRGIWINGRTNLIEDLYTGEEKGFEIVQSPMIIGDPGKDDWDRFNKTTMDVNPEQADGGSRLHWLEYGDPSTNGERILVAVWVLNRAASRPDQRAGVHVFLGPPTDIDWYRPPEVFPYKIKRFGPDMLQPYSHHAHFYLSTQSGPGGRPPGNAFAIAYQSLASKKSHILIMPLNAFGFRGPIPCRAGLLRLAREVISYVSDNTMRTLPPRSTFPTSAIQTVDRLAISGYSAGAVEAARLFTISGLKELSETYRSNRNDKEAQAWAARLDRLTPNLWESPSADLDRRWKEFYSVDGFYGSNAASAFPASISQWFNADDERLLRVYATTGRMADPEEVRRTRLEKVFPGVVPQQASRGSDSSFAAKQWQRQDNRATFAWFADRYMEFSRISRMPTDDAHHTIPRVVFSHALALTGC